MKTAIIICITILFSGTNFAQDYAAAIKFDAEKMNAAFLNGDIETLLNYTYPKVFEVVGDRNYMAEQMSDYLMQMQLGGYTIDTATMSSPGPVYVSGPELHCIVNQNIYSTFPGGTLKNDAPLLAVSMDTGLHWYFVDMRNIPANLINILFPDFNPNLKIPITPPPVIIYNDGNTNDN